MQRSDYGLERQGGASMPAACVEVDKVNRRSPLQL
jgi:hypothetical protein